jgi:hypothetical protein
MTSTRRRLVVFQNMRLVVVVLQHLTRRIRRPEYAPYDP